MDNVPTAPGAELEFTDFARSRKEMVKRVHVLKTKDAKGVDRLKVAKSILDVYEAIGGVTSHAMWAQQNQDSFYSKQYAKLAPSQSDLRVQGEFVIKAPLPRNPSIDGEFEECDPKVSAETT
jgi:hypothetical protein